MAAEGGQSPDLTAWEYVLLVVPHDVRVVVYEDWTHAEIDDPDIGNSREYNVWMFFHRQSDKAYLHHTKVPRDPSIRWDRWTIGSLNRALRVERDIDGYPTKLKSLHDFTAPLPSRGD